MDEYIIHERRANLPAAVELSERAKAAAERGSQLMCKSLTGPESVPYEVFEQQVKERQPQDATESQEKSEANLAKAPQLFRLVQLDYVFANEKSPRQIEIDKQYEAAMYKGLLRSGSPSVRATEYYLPSSKNHWYDKPKRVTREEYLESLRGEAYFEASELWDAQACEDGNYTGLVITLPGLSSQEEEDGLLQVTGSAAM